MNLNSRNNYLLGAFNLSEASLSATVNSQTQEPVHDDNIFVAHS